MNFPPFPQITLNPNYIVLFSPSPKHLQLFTCICLSTSFFLCWNGLFLSLLDSLTLSCHYPCQTSPFPDLPFFAVLSVPWSLLSQHFDFPKPCEDRGCCISSLVSGSQYIFVSLIIHFIICLPVKLLSSLNMVTKSCVCVCMCIFLKFLIFFLNVGQFLGQHEYQVCICWIQYWVFIWILNYLARIREGERVGAP